MRQIIFTTFMKASRLFAGRGLGKRLPFIGLFYTFLFRRLKPAQDIVMVDVRGIKMYADVQTTELGAGCIHGYFYKGPTELLKKIVKEGMIVVDLGANIGYFTLIAAELVGEKGRVYAFEPEPNNHRLLVKNIELNGYNNIIPLQKAVSNQAGVTKLFLAPLTAGAHRINDSHYGRGSIEIETVALDEFFKDRESRVDVVTMDVIGAEMAVLQGMREILKKNHGIKIIGEFFPEFIRRSGYSLEDGLNELIKDGFKLYHINELKSEITPMDIDSLMQMCPGEAYTSIYIARH